MNIGFIGLGAVARTFCEPIAAAGHRVLGYDALYPGRETAFAERFRGVPVHFARSLKALAGDCDLLFSAVTTDVAVKVARQAADLLRPEQWYVDLNSTSPGRKVAIAEALDDKARFAEAAILGAVGTTGAKTKILLGGPGVEEVVDLLATCGLRVAAFGDRVGQASQFKMIRSVFSKGMETLLLEMLTAGELAGIRREIWEDIVEFMTHKPFEDICNNWIVTHPGAAERRGFEMEQVAETLGELGWTPHMSLASRRVFDRSVKLGLKERFPEQPADAAEVIRALAAEAHFEG